MFHLVKFNYVIPTVYYSCRGFRSLRRYVNTLDVPIGGLSYEVYDKRGHHVGVFVRFHNKYRATFIKSNRYETKDYGAIWFAHKAPEMDSRCRSLLDRFYPCSSGLDVLRFCAEDFDKNT